MILPKIESNAITQNYGSFTIGPLERGFGTTIGNAMRRVLLSSLEGAAVTTLRVMGVAHEFSAIPFVKEDMTQLILQVKKLRLKMADVDATPLRMTLNVTTEGVVTAADIDAPAEIEIVNPDLYLFTVDSSGANVEMEFNVERGRGYSPAEERGRLPIGMLPVDAIFSPITRVNYRVEQARVEQKTDYDRLQLEIWTDGTISPEDALVEAASILVTHLASFANLNVQQHQPVMEPPPGSSSADTQGIPSDYYDIPIEQLDLSVRVFNSLKRTGITNVGEVLEMLERGPDAMLAIRNFGEKSLEELISLLREKGYLPSEEN
ncbi:MAG: DNA-directed RNA polymerase subunit alpha [Phototrophicales bacterium]|nr:MAG: DNA-directed RNA polymerase subunit alpha [Phototrophicales bacterium]